MSKAITLLSMLVLVMSSTAWASAYKWENSDKQVEYSQMPPDNAQATEIAAPPPPASGSTSQSNAQQLVDQQQKQEATDKVQKALNEAKEEEDKAMAHNCEQFRTYLSNLESKERIKLIDSQGNMVMLTQEQRTAEIDKAHEGIKKYCKAGSEAQSQSTLPSTGEKSKEEGKR